METFVSPWSDTWKRALKSRPFRYNFAFSFISLVVILLVSLKFLLFAEGRKGIFLNDIVLKYLPPYDLSAWIFFFIYSALLIGMGHISRFPFRLVIAFYVYSVVLIFRMLSIYFFPLEVPANFVLLHDPFVEFFAGAGKPVTKDLFFSGHTATMILIYFFVKNGWLKIFSFVLTVIVAVMLLFQHVHYTMDVVAAPFFAYAGYKLVMKFYRRIGQFSLLSERKKLEAMVRDE